MRLFLLLVLFSTFLSANEVSFDVPSNDELPQELWYLTNHGLVGKIDGSSPNSGIEMPKAWDLYKEHMGFDSDNKSSQEIQDVLVGVIDGYFGTQAMSDINHIAGENTTTSSGVSTWDELHPLHNAGEHIDSHGAMVSSQVSAKWNGGKVIGTFPLAKVKPYLVKDPTSIFAWFTEKEISAISNALELAKNEVDIVNLSLDARFDLLTLGIQSKMKEFVLSSPKKALIVAAGNSGQDNAATISILNNEFCDVPGVICVSASTRGNNLARKSNYSSESPYLIAPGHNVTAYDASGTVLDGVFGTSFSAPIVAGVFAMIRSVRPDLPSSSIVSIIMYSGDPLDGAVQEGEILESMPNKNKLNAYKALKMAIEVTAPTIMSTPVSNGDESLDWDSFDTWIDPFTLEPAGRLPDSNDFVSIRGNVRICCSDRYIKGLTVEKGASLFAYRRSNYSYASKIHVADEFRAYGDIQKPSEITDITEGHLTVYSSGDTESYGEWHGLNKLYLTWDDFDNSAPYGLKIRGSSSPTANFLWSSDLALDLSHIDFIPKVLASDHKIVIDRLEVGSFESGTKQVHISGGELTITDGCGGKINSTENVNFNFTNTAGMRCIVDTPGVINVSGDDITHYGTLKASKINLYGNNYIAPNNTYHQTLILFDGDLEIHPDAVLATIANPYWATNNSFATISGDLINNGTVTEYGKNLYITVNGNVTNNGEITTRPELYLKRLYAFWGWNSLNITQFNPHILNHKLVGIF